MQVADRSFGSGWYDAETVDLFASEYGWSQDIIERLYRSEFIPLVKALQKRKLADEYREMREHWAFLAAVTANSALGAAASIAASMSGKRGRKPKEIKPEDFLDKKFVKMMKAMLDEYGDENEKAQPRDRGWAPQIQDAKAKGLKGPW